MEGNRFPLPDEHRAQIKSILGSSYEPCSGCQGNVIICPLMLFAGVGGLGGAALFSDFGLHEWACLGIRTGPQKVLCSRYLSGELVYPFPKLYEADAYWYVRAKDVLTATANLKLSPEKPGWSRMTQLMMATIYNYGPITIGYNVYQSFMRFGQIRRRRGNRQGECPIWTAAQYIQDFNE